MTEASWKALLPALVDHRVQGVEGPVMNQDEVGCCSAFSLAATMNNAILRQNKIDAISPMHLWAHYFTEGMAPASEANRDRPLSVLGVWPYDQVAACKINRDDDACDQYYHVQKEPPPWETALALRVVQADQEGSWKLTSVTCVDGPLCTPAIAVDPGVLAAYLATGADLWAALWMDVQAWYHPVSGVIPDYDIPAAAIANGSAQAHAVSIAGYDWSYNDPPRFLLHNSWGASWGEEGYAWISGAMVTKYLQAAYKITAAPVNGPELPPADPNALTDDDCPEDEVTDSTTGRCASICPGDKRPANGRCPTG